jgi:hypothetical protein
MAAFLMFRGYLPVVPGVILMVVLAFLFGLLTADFTAIVIDIWNDALGSVQQWLERIIVYIGFFLQDSSVLVEKYEVYKGDFQVVASYSSLNDFDYANSKYITYPSQFGLLFSGYFEFFSMGSSAIPTEVYGMGVYFIGELVLFATLMLLAVRRGQRVPDIKQRFGE